MESPRAVAKNPMAATWTKAAKVRRAFKSGKKRQKDVEYDAERALIECRIAFINIRVAMHAEGIATASQDIKVGLAMVNVAGGSGTVHLVPLPRVMEELPEAYAKAAVLEQTDKAVPLGIVFWQRDRETDSPGAEVSVWAQPWLTGDRAERAVTAARVAFIQSEGEETQAAFQ